MTPPTLIRRVDVAAIDIPLKKPFGIATGAQVVAANAQVVVELADGTLGFGEAAPFPAYNGDTQAAALDAITRARPALLGADARAWRGIAEAMRPLVGHSGSAQCALEMAVLDALTRHAGLPLWALFGGAARELVTDVTITVGTVEESAAEAASFAAAGFSRLKVKVGGRPLAEDLARLAAIHEAAPSAELMLDGNGGMSLEDARTLAWTLRERGIEPILFEQPVPAREWGALAELSRSSGLKIAADESATNAVEVHLLAQIGAVGVINIKPMKSGFAEALSIALTARAAGLELMIGGMVEGTMAMSASACFAAGLGGFSFVDLDTPLFFAEEPFEGGYAQKGERLDLSPIARGHGVTPKEAR